ncbi:hypothetical protein DWB61_01720 [Ancylomarina euxinus]|uniref:DUF3575 domain-containing protein n=1 Tax=Ancylomarina euxinus TaxID=2283627 RepID=A0A425Y8V3_9BACT|nr:hypothetical protein [Ancylomarina euxinus]MCZ4693372.1 hypothetical protein [Ancylomarina euxinus]MUP13600.1 hypothetical protein [Ancylomarina euxinus]RRG24754.1 hypothetical protein DWB61_01720 [Ancylomarina euxinus]
MNYLKYLLIILLFSSFQLSAQDRIIKTDRDTIICKVKEISTDEVKYILPETSMDIVFGIDKNDIIKIILENGKELSFSHSLYGEKTYEDQKKHALKVDFLAPLTGNMTFSYERLIRPSRSWEVSLGIIGLGDDVSDENPRGAFAKFGMKFIKSPDFYLKGLRYAHILKGTYVKPEIAFSTYSYEPSYYYYSYGSGFSSNNEDRVNNWAASLNIIVGKQYVFNDIFLLDMYFGLGYGFSKDDDYEDRGYHYGFTGGNSDTPLTVSAGLKIGILLK